MRTYIERVAEDGKDRFICPPHTFELDDERFSHLGDMISARLAGNDVVREFEIAPIHLVSPLGYHLDFPLNIVHFQLVEDR